jgi:hypothetical protein
LQAIDKQKFIVVKRWKIFLLSSTVPGSSLKWSGSATVTRRNYKSTVIKKITYRRERGPPAAEPQGTRLTTGCPNINFILK